MTSLRQARAETVADLLSDLATPHCAPVWTIGELRDLLVRQEGWTRGELECALSDLLDAGDITLSPEAGALGVSITPLGLLNHAHTSGGADLAA